MSYQRIYDPIPNTSGALGPQDSQLYRCPATSVRLGLGIPHSSHQSSDVSFSSSFNYKVRVEPEAAMMGTYQAKSMEHPRARETATTGCANRHKSRWVVPPPDERREHVDQSRKRSLLSTSPEPVSKASRSDLVNVSDPPVPLRLPAAPIPCPVPALGDLGQNQWANPNQVASVTGSPVPTANAQSSPPSTTAMRQGSLQLGVMLPKPFQAKSQHKCRKMSGVPR